MVHLKSTFYHAAVLTLWCLSFHHISKIVDCLDLIMLVIPAKVSISYRKCLGELNKRNNKTVAQNSGKLKKTDREEWFITLYLSAPTLVDFIVEVLFDS